MNGLSQMSIRSLDKDQDPFKEEEDLLLSMQIGLHLTSLDLKAPG